MFKKRTRPATVAKDIHAAIEEDKPAEGNVEDMTEEGPEEEPNLPSVQVPLFFSLLPTLSIPFMCSKMISIPAIHSQPTSESTC